MKLHISLKLASFMASDLIDNQAIERNEFSLNSTMCNVRTLMSEVILVLEGQTKDKNLTVKFSKKNDPLVVIDGSRI